MYDGFGASATNIAMGFASAIIDNIPVMFAILSMNPDLDQFQWLLVTLTCGIGGSMLSIGSAAGVGADGRGARSIYLLRSFKMDACCPARLCRLYLGAFPDERPFGRGGVRTIFKKLRILKHKLLIFFFFCISYIWLAYFDYLFDFKDDLKINIFYQYITPVAAGVVISFIFYFFVVYLPFAKKRRAIKNNFRRIYKNIKEDIIYEILWDIGKYNGKTSGVGSNLVKNLLDRKKFKEYFSNKDGKTNQKWYDFVNHISGSAEDFQTLVSKFKIIANQINFILHNYEIEDEQHLSFLTNVEIMVFEFESFRNDTDDIKPFCRTIWTIFAGSALVEGSTEYDIIERAVDEI